MSSANHHQPSSSSSSKRSPLTEQDGSDGSTIAASSSSSLSSHAKSSSRNDATTPAAATTQQQSKSQQASSSSAESRENRSLQLPISVEESERTGGPVVERPSTPLAEEVSTNANDSTPSEHTNANDSTPSEQQQQPPDLARDSQGTAENETTAAAMTASTNNNIEEEQQQQQQQQQQRQEEEEEDLASSIELARMLMAEEAMASYQHSFQLLHDSADQLSQEDYNALQAAMMEDERDEAAEFLDEHGGEAAGNGQDGNDDDDDDDEDGDGNLSYETMLQLGERIGDVKAERWAMVAQSHISRLPTETYTKDTKTTKSDGEQQQDDSEHKCLVCQHEYEDNDKLRRLVCGHCFHADCVDQWLARTDLCPYCRTSIVPNED